MEPDVLKNQGLVYKIAKKYASVNSADYEDYCQEGFIALDKAIKNFKKDKGVKFSSYAWKIIERDILRYISKNNRNVRIPENAYADDAKVYKFEHEYKLRKGYAPSIEVISKNTGLSSSRINKIKSIFNNSEFSIYTKLSGKDNEQNVEFLDIYTENNYQNPETEAMNKSRVECCKELLSSLDRSYRGVLIDRFGFNGDKLTYKEIGEKYGFSKQRAKQIEKNALTKLRSIAISNHLESYL